MKRSGTRKTFSWNQGGAQTEVAAVEEPLPGSSTDGRRPCLPWRQASKRRIHGRGRSAPPVYADPGLRLSAPGRPCEPIAPPPWVGPPLLAVRSAVASVSTSGACKARGLDARILILPRRMEEGRIPLSAGHPAPVGLPSCSHAKPRPTWSRAWRRPEPLRPGFHHLLGYLMWRSTPLVKEAYQRLYVREGEANRGWHG